MEQKLSLKNCSIKDKKALIRVDFNVPLDKEGHITDDTRIQSSLPTIRYVIENGGAAILMSHLGRPKNGKIPALSLKPCATRLSELLNKEVLFSPDCIGSDAEDMAKNLKPGDVLLLENLRFHAAEEAPEESSAFAKQLAGLGDFFVNDAFGTAHRAHSSTAVITQFFPGKAAAGFLMEKEIEYLGSILKNPERPFHAIIGGSKISSKIGVLKALLKKVDALLIGGGMAYTFFKAQGLEIGNSICEDEHLQSAREVLQACHAAGVALILPVDNVIVSGEIVKIIETKNGVPAEFKGVDIGPRTITEFLNTLRNAKTILWNGPVGIFEDPRFANGTLSIAKALPSMNALTIVGGGDSVSAIQQSGVADKISHLSTGGGATLEFIEFGTLPGIEALSNK